MNCKLNKYIICAKTINSLINVQSFSDSDVTNVHFKIFNKKRSIANNVIEHTYDLFEFF